MQLHSFGTVIGPRALVGHHGIPSHSTDATLHHKGKKLIKQEEFISKGGDGRVK